MATHAHDAGRELHASEGVADADAQGGLETTVHGC